MSRPETFGMILIYRKISEHSVTSEKSQENKPGQKTSVWLGSSCE